MTRINYARVQTARNTDDLVEFAAAAHVFMKRNVAIEAGSFHDANDPTILAGASCVIASPSYPAADPGLTDQNYVFHWIRDGAIAAMELAAAPTPDANGVDRTLCDYVAFSRTCQNSAVNANKFFLARFTVGGGVLTTGWDDNNHAYTGTWSQQKDGPALQSLSFVAAWAYLDADARTTATNVAQRNLDETVKAWNNNDGMDGPWEDMSGPSLFAQAAQIRFLEEVLDTNTLQLAVPADVKPALDGLKAALEIHWKPEEGLYESIPGGIPAGSTDASEYDPNADVIMAHVYGSIPCTDPQLLATGAKLRSAFVGGPHAFPINAADDARHLGPMIGRYPSDNYDGDVKDAPNEGQPWAICTANFAQLYYCVAKAYQTGNGPAWDSLTAAFFTQVGLDQPTVNADEQAVADALITAGDKMLRALMFHSASGHLSEQFDKVSGYEKSVEDLTWSYAAFTFALRARPS